MESAIATLLAKDQIRELIDTFTLYLDAVATSKSEVDHANFASIHTDDCEFVHPIAVLTGGKAIADTAVHGLTAFAATHHFLGNVKVTKLDIQAGTAEAIVNAIYTHVWKSRPGVDGVDMLKEYTQTGGKYAFAFRKEGDQWKISRNNYTAIWYTGQGPLL